MTTIAWDGKTLAADRQAAQNGMRFAKTKVAAAADGGICGVAGER